MKHLVLSAIGLIIGLVHGASAQDAKLAVEFADNSWNGRSVPATQVCQKFQGKGASPSLKIGNLPAGTSAIVVWFNDDTYSAMSRGGHGAIRFAIAATDSVTIPSVPGETDTLPDGVTVVAKHRGTSWSGTGGAYLPPCSGGQNNKYSASVFAVGAPGGGEEKVLGQGRIDLGRY
jgi:hypothetical protein